MNALLYGSVAIYKYNEGKKQSALKRSRITINRDGLKHDDISTFQFGVLFGVPDWAECRLFLHLVFYHYSRS